MAGKKSMNNGQNFATLDLFSRGRAEMVVGRGSFTAARAVPSVAKERGWPPITRAGFHAQRGVHGALLIGDPEEVAERILRHSEALGGISRITFLVSAASPLSSTVTTQCLQQYQQSTLEQPQ